MVTIDELDEECRAFYLDRPCATIVAMLNEMDAQEVVDDYHEDKPVRRKLDPAIDRVNVWPLLRDGIWGRSL